MCTNDCQDCPFEFSERSDIAQNYGCLPEPSDFIRIKEQTNLNMSCHADENKICKGFASYIKQRPHLKLSCKTGKIISNSKWQTLGEQIAINYAT